ncbi:MAG: helicase C-terminal domain-containing protein [Candidatus Thermoplasmatota archaeon]|jgi:DNA excision repair protein ERCC-2|nr:helicase C-terminal domain-containing protein [Candidatus Thermoplasmatota archaeon]
MSVKFCKKCKQLLPPRTVRCPRCGERNGGIPEITRKSLSSIVRASPHRESRGPFALEPQRKIEKMKKLAETAPSKPPLGYPLFPFGNIRGGQIDFLNDCKKAFNQGMHLVAYAPTGIGKTVASLVPALEEAIKQKKTILFLTSKQSQHKMAVDTLRSIYHRSPYLLELLKKTPPRDALRENAHSGAVNLIVVDIISKQDMCPRSFAREYHAVFNEFCKMEKKIKKCPYIKGKKTNVYRNIEEEILHVDELKEMAVSHMMCPHMAALAVAKYAHVVICDYNYLFSDIADVMLEKMDLELDDIIAIVDEAHNLPDRIRSHLSGDITLNRMRDAMSELQEVDPQLHHFVKQMKDVFANIFSTIGEGREKIVPKKKLLNDVEAILQGTLDGPMDVKKFYDRLIVEGEKRLEAGKGTSTILHLGEFLQTWSKDQPGTVRFGSTKGKTSLCYRLLDPSTISGPVFSGLHSAVLMSGTLFPPRMYGDVLGLGFERTVLREYRSPFPRENRPIYIVDEVTTLYRKRGPDMYRKMADTITEASGTFPGNLAVFFPSYALLQEIEIELSDKWLPKQLVIEERSMKKAEKERLFQKLERLRYMGGGILLGVQGGSLSEGTDYPDGLLKMVIVVGIPLAPPSLEVELLISYYKKLFGQSKGYKYSYLFPALSRVLQAAGRCIRSEEDRGVVILMDRRFGQSNFNTHFPKDFQVRKSHDMMNEIKLFFGE